MGIVFRKHSIKSLIIIMFMLIYIISVAFIYIIISRNISTHIEDILVSTSSDLNMAINANIKAYLLSVEDKVRDIEDATPLISIMNDSTMSASKRKREIEELLTAKISSDPDMVHISMAVIREDGTVYLPTLVRDYLSSKNPYDYNEIRMLEDSKKEKLWIQEHVSYILNIAQHYTQIDDNKQGIFSFSFVKKLHSDTSVTGYIIVNVYTEVINSLYSGLLESNPNLDVKIVNDSGEVISSKLNNSAMDLKKKQGMEKFDISVFKDRAKYVMNKKDIYSVYKMPYTGWNIIQCIDATNYYNIISTLKLFIKLIIIAGAFVCFVIGNAVADSIIIPISALLFAMNKFKKENIY